MLLARAAGPTQGELMPGRRGAAPSPAEAKLWEQTKEERELVGLHHTDILAKMA